MNLSDDMAARHGAMLGELAELGMDLARGLKARADAAASDAEAERLAIAFHRIARDVRLTLALESRLACERETIVRHEQARVRERVETHKDRVRAVLTGAIWREREGEAVEDLLAELDERVEGLALFEGFLERPIEAWVCVLRAELGLPANDAAPATPAAAEAYRRSSA